MGDSLFEIPCTTLDGQRKTLADFPGRAWLVVNTASRCGFTPQYEGLQMLWQRYRERGLVVLGFPCNQFGQQEPGDELEIAEFCQSNYGVGFPLFQKVEVNGPRAHPLFAELKQRAPGLLGSQRVKWNFTKFLVGQEGRVVRRFAPTTDPGKLCGEIEALLE